MSKAKRAQVPVVRLAMIALPLLAGAACAPDVTPNVFTLPHCDQVESSCGPERDESCCAAGEVKGGLFERRNDKAYQAAVSDFTLDRFEVTVGRFRQFVESYPGNKPKEGAGAHPRHEGSGWSAAWDAELPADRAALEAELGCDAVFRTWADGKDNETLPINCVSWYVAFAFCAWDEGRLPTEVEWNYAASGGNQQRTYPWGDDAPTLELANFGCDTTMGGCGINFVGSKSPGGDANWGQADVSGNIAEWLLDYHDVLPTTCDNCADLTDGNLGRVTRGGDFSHEDLQLATNLDPISQQPDTKATYLGIRCARDK
jgi:formylglycine-generating enzyme